VTAWLDEDCGEGWFPDGCALVPDLTSLIVSAAVAIVAVLAVVIVRPTRCRLAVDRLA
jgi:hypothetical protein